MLQEYIKKNYSRKLSPRLVFNGLLMIDVNRLSSSVKAKHLENFLIVSKLFKINLLSKVNKKWERKHEHIKSYFWEAEEKKPGVVDDDFSTTCQLVRLKRRSYSKFDTQAAVVSLAEIIIILKYMLQIPNISRVLPSPSKAEDKKLQNILLKYTQRT